jgi:hypothetical protein
LIFDNLVDPGRWGSSVRLEDTRCPEDRQENDEQKDGSWSTIKKKIIDPSFVNTPERVGPNLGRRTKWGKVAQKWGKVAQKWRKTGKNGAKMGQNTTQQIMYNNLS